MLVQKPAKKRPEPFNRDQLFLSIYEVCKHRPRALTESAALTETILSMVLKSINQSVIERDTIVAVTYETLTNFDKTAAAVYAAYHQV